MLYPSVTCLPTTLYPKCPLQKEKYKADREGSVHFLTYALSVLNKKHICLLKPLALIPCAWLFLKQGAAVLQMQGFVKGKHERM